MRVRTDQAREDKRAPIGPRDATSPVPFTTPSADAARQLLAAARAAAAHRRPGAALAAALEALGARVHDPFDATIDPTATDELARSTDGQAAVPDLDPRASSDRDDGPPPHPLVLRTALRGRPPEVAILAEWIEAVDRLAAAAGLDKEAREADDRKALVVRARRRERARADGADEREHERGEVGFDDGGGARLARGDHRGPERERDRHDARREGERRQKETEKGTQALLRGPTPKEEAKVPRKAPARTTEPSRAMPPAPSLKEKPRPDEPTRGEADAGSADAVAAWRGRVVAKATAVTAPPLPDAERYVVEYRAATVKARQQTPQEKLDLIASAEKAIQPIEKFDESELKLPVPDPLPAKRLEVEGECGRTIEPQALPDLEKSPLGTLPEIGTQVAADDFGGKHVLREMGANKYSEIVVLPPGGKPPQLMEGIRERELRKEQKLEGKGTLAERVRAHNEKEPRNVVGKSNKAKGAVISNDLPKGAPKFPRLQGIPKVDTMKVVARVLDRVDPNARSIVETTMASYPGGPKLKELRPSYVDDYTPQVKSDLIKELRRVAHACEKGGHALDDRLQKEEENVHKTVEDAKQAIEAANQQAKGDRRLIHEEIQDHIGGVLDDLERRIDDQQAVAKGGFDPEAVKQEKQRILDANRLRVETWLDNYDTLGRERLAQLKTARDRQRQAYEAAAELDRRQLDAQTGDKPTEETKKEISAAKKQVDDWENDRRLALLKKVGPGRNTLMDAASATIARYKKGLTDKADEYVTAVKKWADDRLGLEKKWWNKLIDWIRSWVGIARKEKNAWEARSTTSTKNALDRDELALDKLIVLHSKGMTDREIDARRDLSEAQKAIAKSYFTSAQKGDSVGALAAGLVAEVGVQWRPRLHKILDERVLGETSDVVIEVGEASGGRIAERVNNLVAGFGGAGTNKEKVFKALGGLTPVQARAVQFAYEKRTGASLRFDIAGELYDLGDQITGSPQDAHRALALLKGTEGGKKNYEDIAVQLNATMKAAGWGTGIGTDKEEMFKVLASLSEEDRQGVRWAYKEKYGVELDEHVEGELEYGWSSVYDQMQYDAIMRGDAEAAQSIAMRRAHGFVADDLSAQAFNYIYVKDYKAADQVYVDIRADVEADAQMAAASGHPWDNAEFDRQLKRRLEKFDATFGDMFGADFKNLKPGESALEAAHQTVFSRDQAKLLTGVRRQDFAMESAARISIEHKALILPDKKEVNKTLEDQYDRSFAEARRDLEVQDQKDQQREWEECAVKDPKTGRLDRDKTEEKRKEWRKKWLDPDARALHRRALDRKAEAVAREATKQKMWDLKVAYEKDFASGSIFSQGSFEGDVYSATNVAWPTRRTADTDKTMALIQGSGYLTPAQQLLFGVKGTGTDEAAVQKAYRGRSADEIATIHGDLRRLMTAAGVDAGWDAAAWVLDDFSGSELDDVTIQMLGEPITAEEKLHVERQRVELEKRSAKGSAATDALIGGILGGPVGAAVGHDVFGALREYIGRDQRQFMESRIQQLEKDIAALEQAKVDLAKRGIHEGDAEYYEGLAKFYDEIDKTVEAVRDAVQAHRDALNAAVSWVTIVIQVVVGIGSLIAGIVLTPVTGGLSVGIAVAVIGALVATGLTMAAKAAIKGDAYGWEEAATDAAVGIVDAIAAGITAGVAGHVLKGLGLAKDQLDNMVTALVRQSLGHFVSGTAGAAPGVALATLLNDGTFMDALSQIVQAGLMAVAVGHATDPVTAHFQAQKAFVARTSPVEFEKAFKAFQLEHPGQRRSVLRAQLDEMILASRPGAFREPAMQNAMRADLLDGLPPPQRKAMERARIDVVSERDYKRVAGKAASEHATVLVKDGVPVVVVKAGTDLTTLGRQVPEIFRGAAEMLGPPPAKSAVEQATPRPRGASASPDPLGPGVAGEPPPRKVIVEPYAGPDLESAIDLARRSPGAHVVATEPRIMPDAAEVARANKAGVTFVPDNKPGHLPVGSVDDIKMRFPIPHERAVQQDFMRRLADLEALHPNVPRKELLERAMHDTVHQAESLTAYGPYALERLKPGGSMEVVFWERQILVELGDVGRLRLVDPATGRGYRLELVALDVTTRGAAAPHSGFGITGITNETQVHVARFQKVELETRLPTGGRGPDVVGEVVGAHSGRAFFPERAGGPIRDLDYQKIRFTEKGVDVVEAHCRRFGGGGEMELAMVERLRLIARGEIPATEFDRAFYSHELRESVRYRKMGLAKGEPLSADEAYRAWNDAHTATLEDYKLREKLPGGRSTLFHPEVVERIEPAPTGARGPTRVELEAVPEAARLAPREPLEPQVRRGLETELRALGHAPETLRNLTDRELVGRYVRAQVEQAPARIADFRSKLSTTARAELDALRSATHLHLQPVDADLAIRLQSALETPVRFDDPTIPRGAIRVGKGSGGRLVLRVGIDATLGDVLGHIPTVGALKRYEGAIGIVRRVADAVGRVFGRSGPPFGTRAFEAWLEIQKLPGLIENRRLRLLDRDLDVTTRLKVEAEIARIERQLVSHINELGDLSPGRGYVAVEGSIHVKSVDEPDAGAKRPFDRSEFPDEVQQAIEAAGQSGYVFDPTNWTLAEARLLPPGEYIYIVRDVGEPVFGEGVLKVGETSNARGSEPLDRRMGVYRNAAEVTGRKVQVELYLIETPLKASEIETALRRHLYDRAPGTNAEKGFDWDNKAPHNLQRFGPGTPEEPPRHYEDVLILRETGRTTEDGKRKEIVVRHEDGFEQTVMTRKTECEAGKKFLIPQSDLYEWRRFNDRDWGLVRRGEAAGTRPEVKLTPTEALRTMPPADRRAELERLLEKHRGANIGRVLEAVGAELGVSRTQMYQLLRPPFVDPPIDPVEFTSKARTAVTTSTGGKGST